LTNTQFQPLGRSSNGESIDLFVYMDSIGCLGNEWKNAEKQRNNFIEYYGGKQLRECFREIHFRIEAGATCKTFIGMVTKDIIQFGKETELAEGKLDFEEASGNAQLVEKGKFKIKHQILLITDCNDAVGTDWTPWEVIPEPLLQAAEKLSKILQKCSRVTILGPGDDEIWQTPGFEAQANVIMDTLIGGSGHLRVQLPTSFKDIAHKTKRNTKTKVTTRDKFHFAANDGDCRKFFSGVIDAVKFGHAIHNIRHAYKALLNVENSTSEIYYPSSPKVIFGAA
jgi:hypothetical protein